jgi:hypothetical protein
MSWLSEASGNSRRRQHIATILPGISLRLRILHGTNVALIGNGPPAALHMYMEESL